MCVAVQTYEDIMFLLFVLYYLFPASLCFQESQINISITYFKHRGVKFICYLNPGNAIGGQLAKVAFEHSIAISVAVTKSANGYGDVERCLEQQTSPIGVLMDSNCLDSGHILSYASQNMLFDASHNWLLIEKLNNTLFEEVLNRKAVKDNYIVESLNNFNLSVDADIALAIGNDYNQYIIYEVYNFGKIQSSELIIEKVGTSTKELGFHLIRNLNDYKYYRRWNFKQCKLRLITVVSPTPKNFTIDMLIDRRPVAGIAAITKTGLIILNVIAEIHNIRFIYTITDRWIGTYEKNSSRVVANSLYFKEQDITPILRPISSYFDKIDFLHTPVSAIETKYYYRIPSFGPGKFENHFLRPLTVGAWGCVITVIVLCAFVLLLSAIFEQRPMIFQYAVFSVIASFCQQFFEDVGDKESRRTSTARKLGMLVTGLSCVLIYNYYTSSVVSWLLNGPPPSINSLRELIDSPLELIFEDIGYTRSWLQTPSFYYNKRNAIDENDLRQKKVFNKKKGAPLFKTVEEGIAMVKEGGYAYHTEVDSANTVISKTFTQMELCELGSLQSIDKGPLLSSVPKNSPYKEFFGWSLLRLWERGIISCIQRRTTSQAVTCEGSSPRALALGGAAPAFILLFGGFVLAVIIMLLERLMYKMKITAKC